MGMIKIDYDLNKPGQNYDSLIKEIKRIGTDWCNPLKSSWLIRGQFTAAAVRDDLKQYIDSGDALLVMDVTRDDWASWGLSTEVNDWLQKV